MDDGRERPSLGEQAPGGGLRVLVVAPLEVSRLERLVDDAIPEAPERANGAAETGVAAPAIVGLVARGVMSDAGTPPPAERGTPPGRGRWSVGAVARLGVRAVQGLLEDRGPDLAASISFRVLFSLFPLAIVLAALFAIVAEATGIRADVVEAIVDNVPLTGDGKDELRTLLEGATGSASALGLFALVGLLWAASGMMSAIRSSLNAAWDVEEARPFVWGKLVDLTLVLTAAVLVLASFVVSIGGRMVSRYASGTLGEVGLSSGAMNLLAGILVPLLLGFGAVLWLYRVVPARRGPLRELVPGAALVAVVAVLLQNGFALYLEHFTSYNAVYGSLGAMIGFLFYVYVASLVFLLGAQLSARLPEVRDELGREREPSDGTPLSTKVRRALRGLVRRS